MAEYLLDLSATRAAVRAGYSGATAGSIGHENLKKPEIHRAIQAALADRAKRTAVEADRVLREVSYIAFSDVRDVRVRPDGRLHASFPRRRGPWPGTRSTGWTPRPGPGPGSP